jgi:hypothetical protein
VAFKFAAIMDPDNMWVPQCRGQVGLTLEPLAEVAVDGHRLSEDASPPGPYHIGVPGMYICSTATPPGPGAHGMSGATAANTAVGYLRSQPLPHRSSSPHALFALAQQRFAPNSLTCRATLHTRHGWLLGGLGQVAHGLDGDVKLDRAQRVVDGPAGELFDAGKPVAHRVPMTVKALAGFGH